jgi:hypothetical protein
LATYSTADSESRNVFSKEGKFEWERPQFVRFALILACGGGSGGGNPRRAHGGMLFDTGIPPGIGAPVVTTVIGPLTEARYRIQIGKGGDGSAAPLDRIAVSAPGASGAPGGDTTLSWDGANPGRLTFPGAKPDPKFIPQNTDYPNMNREEIPAWTVTQISGSQRGDVGKAPPERGKGSLGGFPGLGRGGTGGDPGKDGGAGEQCAGGGASGVLLDWNAKVVGGKGGDGFLRIIPLVDVGVVEERLQQALAAARVAPTGPVTPNPNTPPH